MSWTTAMLEASSASWRLNCMGCNMCMTYVLLMSLILITPNIQVDPVLRHHAISLSLEGELIFVRPKNPKRMTHFEICMLGNESRWAADCFTEGIQLTLQYILHPFAIDRLPNFLNTLYSLPQSWRSWCRCLAFFSKALSLRVRGSCRKNVLIATPPSPLYGELEI